MHPVFDTHFHIIDPRFPVLEDTLAKKVFFDNAVELYRPARLAR